MLIPIAIAEDEISSTREVVEIKLSDVEVRYLTERLRDKEYMSEPDIEHTIVELEHFYTILANNEGLFEPSEMVDKAWHHHILNTRMYGDFSRLNFGMDILHHMPYWSGNTEEVEEMASSDGEFDAMATYNALVSMYGSENVNKTVWVESQNEPHGGQFETIEHTEF
jgi:hypothetical protein